MSLRNKDDEGNLIDAVVETPDLRWLTMESEEDIIFVRNTPNVPKPAGKEYDYIQMSRLLTKSTLRKLYDLKLF